MVNIRQLQVFKTLCDELNFTKTAEKLNMTQPAVSHVIGSLDGCWIYMMICGSISGRRKSSSRCEWALV